MTDINVHKSSFFEVIARVIVTADDGTSKRKRMVAAVEASTFTEAEAAGTGYFSAEGEDVEIANINPAPYRDIYDSQSGDTWFRVKVKFITLDERTGTPRNSFTVYLVKADSTQHAQRVVTTALSDSVVDYEIAAVVETPVCDAVFHSPKPHGND